MASWWKQYKKGPTLATSDLQYRIGGDPIRSEGGFTHQKKVDAIGGGFLRPEDDVNDRRMVF